MIIKSILTMNLKSLSILTIFILFLETKAIFSQNLKAYIEELSKKEIKDENGPGLSLLVAKNGETIYQSSFGKANIELNVNMNTDNIFQIGSMTKQFTAIAILMLEEEGKLSITDSITKYIKDYPNGHKITIHHLLTHTSGIKDFTKIKTLKDITSKEMSPTMMIDFFKTEAVDFKPGEKFDYNNSGYFLLGHIIELTSGLTYKDFIEQKIFKPLSMIHTSYNSDRNIIMNRAYGYQKKDTTFVNKTVINYSIPFASGALMSNLEDMLKWQNALSKGLLLKKENVNKAFRKYKLNNGEETNYGYGWHIRTINNKVSLEHGGSIFGFKSMAVYIPEEDIYVVGFTNCDCISPTKLIQDIAKFALEL